MATYNWTYQPGKANPYNITINSSANDVQPSNAVYIALWGNDTTGNGSRMFPYRTVAYGATRVGSYGYVIVGNGVYRENNIPGSGNKIFIGDGDVVFDFTYFQSPCFDSNTSGINLNNIKFLGAAVPLLGFQYEASVNATDCIFDNCRPTGGNSYMAAANFTNCIFRNLTLPMIVGFNQSRANQIYVTNCTFYRCNGIAFVTQSTSGNYENITSCIFSYCNIGYSISINARYSLFFNCNFAYTDTPSSAAVYPNIPTGYKNYASIAALQSDFYTNTNGLTGFTYCNLGDPGFNNPAYNDFSLSFSSLAKNMSYQGGYIGAKSIAYSLNPKADPIVSDFENDTAHNLNIADNSITLTDPTQTGWIITKPIVNGSARELARFAVFGVNADRNGQYVDATPDQAAVTLNAGNSLNAGTPYSVETGAITYNGVVYQPGARFTSLETNPGTFTTSAGGVVREITEAAARENVLVRFNDGTNPQISSGTALEALGRYYVVSGSITYNGTTYNAGQVFKADNTGTNSFTGTGAIQLMFRDSDPWLYFELNTKPQSNNSGNTRTGAIVLGNGDPNYDRTAANVFNINQKFMQLQYVIQVNNLTP